MVKLLLITILYFPYFCLGQDYIEFKLILDKKNELSNKEIHSLYKDYRGYLWIGTNNGLLRYDGNTIKHFKYDNTDTSALGGYIVATIYPAPDGTLWLGTNKGISKFNPASQKFKNYNNNNRKFLHTGDRNKLFYDKHGTLWLYSNYSGLYKYDTKLDAFIKILSSEITGIEFSAAYDSKDIIYCTGQKGFFKFHISTGVQEKIRIPKKYIPLFQKINSKTNIHVHNNSIWLGTWGYGLLNFDTDFKYLKQWFWVEHPNVIEYNNIVSDVQFYNDGYNNEHLFVASEKGVVHWKVNKQGNFLHPGKKIYPILSSNVIYAKNDEIWVGSAASGLWLANISQKLYHKLPNLSTSSISNFYKCNDGKFLLSGTLPALIITDSIGTNEMTYTNLSQDQGNQEGLISWSAVKDEKNGLIYACTFDGLTCINLKTNNKTYFKYKPMDSYGLKGRKVTHVLPINDNKLLLGIWKRGVQYYDTKTKKNIKYITENCIVRNLKLLRNGTVSLMGEGFLSIFDPKTLETKSICVPSEDIAYNDIYEINDTLIYITSSEGIWLYDLCNENILKEYGEKNSILPFEIFQITKDNQNRFWLNANNELIVFLPEKEVYYQLKEWKKVFGNIGILKQFNTKQIWFSADDNLYKVNAESFKCPDLPNVYITSFAINNIDTFPDVYFENIHKIILKPGQNDFSIGFQMVGSGYQKRTRYDYQLEGFQKDWIKNVEFTRVNFYNLPTGDFTFRVKKSGKEDLPNNLASLRIKVTNHIWERNWFRALIIIIISFIISYFIFTYFTKVIKLNSLLLESELNQFKSLEVERSRIAQDLHDDLGSNISALRLIAELIKIKNPSPDGNSEIGKVVEIATSLNEKIKEIIWVTNVKNDNIENLIGYIQNYSHNIFESVDIEYNESIPGFIPNIKINNIERKMIFLAFKESINNIIKHANASFVQVNICIENSSLNINIKDNGIGFDFKKNQNTRNDGRGNGLLNMSERMKTIDGECFIESSVGNGSSVTLRIKFN